ncbi:MAG: hypothetical protein ABUL47_04445, partial [Leifsonia sp.]
MTLGTDRRRADALAEADVNRRLASMRRRLKAAHLAPERAHLAYEGGALVMRVHIGTMRPEVSKAFHEQLPARFADDPVNAIV